MKPKVLTKSQAAVRIDRSEKTVERLIALGKLRATKVDGRWKLLESDVDAYLLRGMPMPQESGVQAA